MGATGAEPDREFSEFSEFSEFAVGVYAPLLKTARLMTGDSHTAEDMVQSTLERVYVRWNRSASWESPHAYARQVLVNLILKAAKRKWRGELAHADLPEAQAPDAASAVDRRDLAVALRALPLGQRMVVVLRYYEDLSLEQAADVLGCSVGTVKSRANRALAALRASGVLTGYQDHGRDAS